MRTPALMKKEFLHFWRDPALMLMVLWAFTADVYLCAGGFSLDIKRFPVAVYDLDRSQSSTALIEHLRLPRFRIVRYIDDAREIDELLSSGKALMVIAIDDDFSKRLARGESAPVQVILDGTNSHSAALALAHVTSTFSQLPGKSTVVEHLRSGTPPVALRLRIWFNENMESSWFVGLSELFSVITLVAILLPAAALVREKEYGTVEQLLVSPLHPWQIMLSKIIPMMILVLAFTCLCLFAILGAGYNVYPQGSLMVFLLATAIYVGACSGLGMLLATLAKNLSQVILMLTTAIVPIMFLSGTWTPPEAMPSWLRWFTHVSPLSYYLEIGTGIFFRGWGFRHSAEPLMWLTILGGVLFLVGTSRVGKEFA